MTPKVIDFPDQSQSAKDSLEKAGNLQWKQVVCIGFDEKGDFNMICSDMANERLLWLLEMAKKHAMNPS